MAFLTPADMKTHVFTGVMDAISDRDDSIMQQAIDAAVNEAKGYCSRYNVDILFAQSPPDPTLLMYVKNIAKWHFLCLSNANIETEDAHNRYEQAVRWLRDIQAGKTVPYNWPAATAPAGADTFFHVKSNRKRNNHFQ